MKKILYTTSLVFFDHQVLKDEFYDGNIMLYQISVAERGLTGIANIFRSRLSRFGDLLRAGTVPLSYAICIFEICCEAFCYVRGLWKPAG